MECSRATAVWVGLVRQNGVWVFIDGSPPNFLPPPPTVFGGTDENCAYIGSYDS